MDPAAAEPWLGGHGRGQQPRCHRTVTVNTTRHKAKINKINSKVSDTVKKLANI